MVAGNRTEWVTYKNIEVIYNLVYEQMVRAGVANHLAPENYYYVDDKGKRLVQEKNQLVYR